jgi:hypothetical protein
MVRGPSCIVSSPTWTLFRDILNQLAQVDTHEGHDLTHPSKKRLRDDVVSSDASIIDTGNAYGYQGVTHHSNVRVGDVPSIPYFDPSLLTSPTQSQDSQSTFYLPSFDEIPNQKVLLDLLSLCSLTFTTRNPSLE